MWDECPSEDAPADCESLGEYPDDKGVGGSRDVPKPPRAVGPLFPWAAYGGCLSSLVRGMDGFAGVGRASLRLRELADVLICERLVSGMAEKVFPVAPVSSPDDGGPPGWVRSAVGIVS